MAEHLFFVPVSGGLNFTNSSLELQYPGLNNINVQWGYGLYPEGATAPPLDPIFYRTAFTVPDPPTDTAAKLITCAGRWHWTSTASGGSIVYGAQLEAGIPFANSLPTASLPITFATIDIWVKVLVVNADRLSKLYVALCDKAGNIRSTSFSGTGSGASNILSGYKVYRYTDTGQSFSGWDRENLRAVVTMLGTTNTANVGETDISIEWFAIRLTT